MHYTTLSEIRSGIHTCKARCTKEIKMKPEIIVEIGKNFVTTEEPQPVDKLLIKAYELIDAAKESGAKIVKFQCHVFEDEVHPNISVSSPHFSVDRFTWVKRNSYPAEFWLDIKEYCKKVGVEFLCTPMSRGAAMLLNEDVGVKRWKIGSGDILDFPMLDYIRDTGRPIILSSGMSTLEELKMSYNYLREKTDDVSILHCVSQYPCPLDKLNLNTIPFLKKEFPEAKIGFSDHSAGVLAGAIAVNLGAEIIEKHFTLDKDAWGPDHKVSLSPKWMKDFIKEIGDGSKVYSVGQKKETLGKKEKVLNEVEKTFRLSFRKSLYASRDLKENEMYEPDMLIALRPQSLWAHPSEHYPRFLGEFVQQSIKRYDPVSI